MAAVVEVRTKSTGIDTGLLSLPLDEEARFACKGAGVEEEIDGWVFDYLGKELVEKRFTGFVCVKYGTGHRLGLVVLDGTVFGAWLAGPLGEYWGEEALSAAEALLGPARVKFAPRPAYEIA
ncbi:hypothetical protein PYJP_02520 [Pyrofollis japonicus]|uniref:hypothetical protein n=1 Tax=Pyrofollis japonicus TaxID=3060460 RepID=UPI00295C227E|nr:hypothetical protein [Pyrofollis japonicus]BEP16900.1 hypothetical protein PYJP_02520 [Pyrofollis japonicus]